MKRLKTEQDEERRRAHQREDGRELVDSIARMKREGRGSGSSEDDSAESRERAPRGSDIRCDSFSSSSSSDVVLTLPSPPSPIGGSCDSSSPADPCSPASASSFASLGSTWDPASRAEPALNAHRLQEIELLSLQHSSDDTLTRQQEQVAAELQQLLLDIYARHGTQHPVFNHPAMASCLAWLLTQGAGTAATARPSTTLPTHVAPSSSPSPAPSITDPFTFPSSPPVFPVHPEEGGCSHDVDAQTFVLTPPTDALTRPAAVVLPSGPSPDVSSPTSTFLGLGFSVARPPSTPRLCSSTPDRPPSRLDLPPSAYSPPLPFLSPPSDHLDPLLLELPCHSVDPSQSILAQCLLKQLNARVPELRVVPLGDTDANALRKVRVSGELDLIVGRMEHHRDVIDELYLSSAEVESQGSGVKAEQQQPYFHATFFLRQRQCV